MLLILVHVNRDETVCWFVAQLMVILHNEEDTHCGSNPLGSHKAPLVVGAFSPICQAGLGGGVDSTHCKHILNFE